MKVRGGARRGDFQEFCNLYDQDLPSLHSQETEMDLWERKWQGVDSLPSTTGDIMANVNKDMYTNIYTALILLQVIPVTSCECERSVSRLRRLKSYLPEVDHGSGAPEWTGVDAHSL